MRLKYSFLVLSLFLLNGILLPQDVPYVPTPNEVVEEMLAVAEVNKNDVLYDLGCGDGRIVVMAAKKYGARGVGIDSNPKRIEESKANAEANNVTELVEFKQQDLFTTDLSDATVVTLYLLTHVNIKLRPMLFEQLKPGTRIVSHAFDMGDWEPEETREVDGRTIYFWRIPYNVSGRWESENDVTNKNNVILDLKQQFNKVSGTIQIDGKTYHITEAKLDKNKIELAMNNGEMKFTGTVDSNSLNGTLNGSDASNITLKATRAANTQTSLDSGL